MKRIPAIIISLIAFIFILFSTGCESDTTGSLATESRGGYQGTQKFEKKIFWAGSSKEDFDGSSVLLVMDKNVGGINKQHDEYFFGSFK